MAMLSYKSATYKFCFNNKLIFAIFSDSDIAPFS